MFHKELTARIKSLESQVRDLKYAADLHYWPRSRQTTEQIPIALAIHRLCDYLNVEFDYECIRKEGHILRKKKLSKKKPKKKAKKKK